MEVRGGKANRAPADEMRKFRIVRTFIEVAHYLFRQVVRIEAHPVSYTHLTLPTILLV